MDHLFLPSAPATRQTILIQNRIGQRKKFTELWDVENSKITELFYRSVGTASGLMAENSPPALGSFATIPKAKRGGPLDWTKYKYLDAVHMDIDVGDCLLGGGNKYALILVDWATWYNWTFRLNHFVRTIFLVPSISFVLPQEV